MIDLTTSPGYSQSEFTESRTVPPLPSATPRELSQVIGTVDPGFLRRAGVSVFKKAHDEDELTVHEFEAYGGTPRTPRQFLAACAELEALVGDVIVPGPANE